MLGSALGQPNNNTTNPMKKAILVALLCLAGVVQSNAQYLKQIINFSLTGYQAPENSVTIGNVRRTTAQSFSLTDRALCLAVASNNGMSVRYPQLIRVTDLNGNLLGYFVTDAGTVVADASAYIARIGHEFNVVSGTEVLNPTTGMVTTTELNHGFDTWAIGLIRVSGLDTIPARFTYPNGGDSSTMVFSQWNFSAPVSGGYTNGNSGTITCCTGFIRGTSSVVKSISGLP